MKKKLLFLHFVKPFSYAATFTASLICSSNVLAITATASSDDGNTALNTLDSSLNTRWSAKGDGEYITYDLGAITKIDDIDIAFFKGNQRLSEIDIQLSNDNNRWTTVFSGFQPNSTLALQNFNFADQNARYARIVGHGNSSGNGWNSITEVKINTLSSAKPVASVPTPTSAPISVSASAQEGSNISENTLDGRLSTRWSAKGDGQSITFNLNSIQTINGVGIAFYKGNERNADIDIQLSKNNNNWQTVYSGSQPNSTVPLQNFNFANTSAQYLRIIGHGNSSGNGWNSITEVKISTVTKPIIDKPEATPKPTSRPTPIVVTPTPTPIVVTPTPAPKTSVPQVGLDPNQSPSTNFDLSEWNLGVPVDNDGNGKSDTIKVDNLNKGYESDFFYTDNDGGMVFKNYIDGAKTSRNTSYTRSELRQILGGNEDEGDTEISPVNWVFSTISSSEQRKSGAVDGILRATLAVNHVTTTGSGLHPGRVIIGQIHAKDNEPCRLYYRKLPGNSKGSIYFAHETENGNETEINLIGSESSRQSNPSNGIALNEVFSYEISAQGDDLTVTILRDGKPNISKSINMKDSGYDKNGQYMYFKAGVYTQNNTGDDDDFDQATFYKLETIH